MITLGNFGITIAPLIAIAGAGAFGATMALQGPLSNYGAGLSIIMARPFVVGDTITLGSVSGVVDDISLGATRLLGEDGERILVPNREIVGQIIINSDHRRVVQSKIYLAYDADVAQAITLIREALDGFPELDRANFITAYSVLAAQRHCKVIGIFTRLSVRDGKHDYLRHIPRVWHLLEKALRHPALAALHDWLAVHLPAAARTNPVRTKQV